MSMPFRRILPVYRFFSVFALVFVRAARSWTTKHVGGQRSLAATASATAQELLVKQATTTSTQILTDNADFLKPDRDNRQYRTIRLPNNLEVLLVSDQLPEGSVGVEAASVHIQAGHFDDTIPGLAHFHEHMLFLGTEKYPNEDEFERYLSQYGGGFSNAYTDMEDTNYYFSMTSPIVNSSETTVALQGALDRLAQFFIAPTFDPDAVERETRAIQSEYSNGKASDNWRTYSILKGSCNPEHPFAKFGCGNYETLHSEGLDSLLSKLQSFWDTYYQTYNMRLTVVGHGSLEALQATVEDTFGKICRSEGEPRRSKSIIGQTFVRENAVYGKVAYGPDQLGKIRWIIPYAESRSIKILFATPPLDDPKLTKTRPYRVISHILGHEGPGSLHAVLNAMGYLTDLTSGVGIDTSDFSLFTLTLSLTPKGMREYEEVLKLVFDWMALLRQHKENLEDYHDELRRISEMNFRFRENGDPTDFCSAASQLLFDEALEHERFLRAGSDTEDFDQTALNEFLDRLDPANCMIHVHNSDLERSDGWEKEKWYGGEYLLEDIPKSSIEVWSNPQSIDERLIWPKLNEYIPTDFSLRSEGKEPRPELATTPPEIILEEPKLRVWHKVDQYWMQPKTFIRVGIVSPHVYSTPRTMTYNRIFQRVLNDDLNSFIYDATLAGCSYNIACMPTGYRIFVKGYNEKLPFLFDTLTSRMLSLIQEMKDNDPNLRQRFDKAIESLLRETKNYRLDTPYEVANYNSRLLMEQSVWYLSNYVDEMEGDNAEANPLTMQECAAAVEEGLLGRVRSDVLCMGNIAKDEAMEVADVLKTKFLDKARPLSDPEVPRYRSLKLPTREEGELIFSPASTVGTVPLVYAELAYSPDEENNAVEFIIQVGSELEMGYKNLALLNLISHIAYNSAFNQLRTKEQNGYTVSAFSRKTVGSTWALSVLIMGSSVKPGHMQSRIEAWLEQFRAELESMDPEEIASEANAIVSQLLEDDTKLSQEVGRAWSEILNTETATEKLRTPDFGRLERLAQELQTGDELSPEDLKAAVLEFFDQWLSAASPDRRAMASHVYSQNSKEEYDAIIARSGVLSSHDDIRQVKEYLSSWPTVPYWRLEDKGVVVSEE